MEMRLNDYVVAASPVVLYFVVTTFVRPAHGGSSTWVAKWFLFNGIIIHLFLDGFLFFSFLLTFLNKQLVNKQPFLLLLLLLLLLGSRLVGGFGFVPPLYAAYSTLDGRYPKKLPLVMLVCFLEISVMFPLCLSTYRAIVQRRPQRHLLQVVTSLIQVVGTYFFTLDEVLGGFQDVPFDRHFEFTFHHVFYFWVFFVAANLLWTFLPLYLIIKAWRPIVGAVQKSEILKMN
jgi:hypothetical protein